MLQVLLLACLGALLLSSQAKWLRLSWAHSELLHPDPRLQPEEIGAEAEWEIL